MGSFDSVNASRSEAFTVLRMTGPCEFPSPRELLILGCAGLRAFFVSVAADQAEFL